MILNRRFRALKKELKLTVDTNISLATELIKEKSEHIETMEKSVKTRDEYIELIASSITYIGQIQTLSDEIIKLRSNAMPGGHGCCDICDTGGCCKAESEEECSEN